MDLKHYLIISNICIVISFVLFRILNRDETMFRQRRIFLILSVILSLILPLSGLRIQLPHSTGNLPVYNYNMVEETINVGIQADNPGIFRNSDMGILYLYLIISGIIGLNILFQLTRVFWFYLLSDKKEGHIIKVNSQRLNSPFSFFKWIFIPWKQVREEDLSSIIIHESVHGKQLHTVDNIILEIACALMWFNPFIWIMKREIHLLHEYLADEGTLKSGIEKITYQSLLINQVAEEKLIIIPSNFNNNNLKKRIIMMTENKKEGHNGLLRRKLVPLSVLILAVSILQGFYPVNVTAQDDNKQQPNKGHIEEHKSKEVKLFRDAIMDSTQTNELQVKIAEYNKGNVLYIINDKESTKKDFEELDSESMESMSVLTGEAMNVYRKKKYDAIVVIRTKKDYQGQDKNSIKMRDVKVVGYAKQDSSGSLSSKIRIRKSGVNTADSLAKINIRRTDGNESNNILYIVDKKEMSKNEFLNIPSEKFDSLFVVMDDKKSVKEYTDKDYDGVIVVTTKK